MRDTSYRKNKNIERKHIVLIAVEGSNKTEVNYFTHYNQRNNDYIIKIARGNNTDPYKLVKGLVKQMKEDQLDISNGDKVYCVFDVDTDIMKEGNIKKAKELATSKGIEMISSTPCIEIWFLLHFKYTTSYLSNTDVLKELKHFIPKYEKSIDIYDSIIENANDAIKRAKKLETYQLSNDNEIGCVNANPNTEIYKLIEYLTNQAK